MVSREYPAELVRIIDGDTVQLRIDLGFFTWRLERFRLAGLDCPEINTEAGKAAQAFTTDWLAKQTPLTIRSHGLDKFGRWLATILGPARADGAACLNSDLITAGHAKPYDGGKRTP